MLSEAIQVYLEDSKAWNEDVLKLQQLMPEPAEDVFSGLDVLIANLKAQIALFTSRANVLVETLGEALGSVSDQSVREFLTALIAEIQNQTQVGLMTTESDSRLEDIEAEYREHLETQLLGTITDRL